MILETIVIKTASKNVALCMFLIFVLSITIITPILVSGYTFVGVTSNGVEFPILAPSVSESTNSTSTGDSILDGIGVYLTIQNINQNGMVYFGEDNTNHSYNTDIRQYVGINPDDDWGIVIDEDDNMETLSVPEFGTEYQYVSGSLVNVTNVEPNVLGYSESRILSGSIIVTTNNDGILFSGNGEMILKLHGYSGDSLFLRGHGDTNSILKIITSDVNLMNDVYHSDGYLTYSDTIDPGTNSFSVIAGIDSTHTGVLSYTAHATSENSNGSCSGWASNSNIPGTIGIQVSTGGGYSNCIYTGVNQIITTLVKTNNANYYTITGDSTAPTLMTLGYYYWGDPVAYYQYNDNFYFELYDTLPSTQLTVFSGGSFEQVLAFPIQQTYLYVKLDGGNSNIKGETFDPNSDIFFQVDGLPEDTAYDITKSGITGIVGKTSSTGEISLLYNDVDFGVSTSPGGILNIYPNSLSYVGDFGIVMFDVLHDYTTILPVGDDLVYIPQNYIYWVFPISVEITNVRVDDIPLDYLSRNYTNNEALYIPVIPSASIIYVTINGEDVEVLMSDVSTTTQIKQVPQESSTSSDYTVDGTASTSSNISTGTFLTATHTGNMNVNFDFKVGGAVDFSMDSTYTGGFIHGKVCKINYSTERLNRYCSAYSIPNDLASISNLQSLTEDHRTELTAAINKGQVSKLTVEVDVIRNMQNAKTIPIYTSNSAEAYITSTFSEAGYGASNQVHMVYPLDDVNYNLSIPVTVGDMVEFMIRVNLEVTGSPTPVSNGAVYSSYVQATTEFGGGIITVGMS